MNLSKDMLRYLALNFNGCLCRGCLKELVALEAEGRLAIPERVDTPERIERLAALADEVWHEFFVGLLSLDQIDYMVEKFQSVKALTEQISSGYEYYIFSVGGREAGFAGIHPESGKLFLSKLYLLKQYRGRGLSSQMLDMIERRARRLGLGAVWLTVNRHNTHSIDVYRHRGFATVREQVADIGSGYVMDDYVMEKTL